MAVVGLAAPAHRPRPLRHFLTVSVTVTVTSFVTVTGLVTVTTWAGSCTVTTFVWVTVGDGWVTVRETVCGLGRRSSP